MINVLVIILLIVAIGEGIAIKRLKELYKSTRIYSKYLENVIKFIQEDENI